MCDVGIRVAPGSRKTFEVPHWLSILAITVPIPAYVQSILRPMAMAAGVTTAPAGGGDGARSEVAPVGDFPQQGGFLVLQSGQRNRSLPAYGA